MPTVGMNMRISSTTPDITCLSVVNGILDMSKIESGNFEITPEPFAPKQVIDDCCELLGYKAREIGIELVVRLPDNLPEIVADKRSLHQIMLNLMSNAVKFTKRGGKVIVSASADDSFVRVTVEDTGVGIDAEDLPRIGDPFFQARSSYDRHHDGTGLGLSIVKGLLALHAGDLRDRERGRQGDLCHHPPAARLRSRPQARRDACRSAGVPRAAQIVGRTAR